MPVISVIIPVYNAEKYLEKCVGSVLAQAEKDLEFILVDDGSTDGSGSLCDSLAEKDSRIKVIHKENGGVSSARNRGLAEAAGEYIAFIDSDDWIEPDMYRNMLRAARENAADVVMCDAVKEYYNKSELFTQDIQSGRYNRDELLKEYFPKLIMQNNLTYPPATSNWLLLIKNDLIKENHLSYPSGIRISEDLFFGACVMYHANSFYYLKGETYYHYYVANTSSSTKKTDTSLWGNYERLLSLLTNKFGKTSDFDFRTQLSHAAVFFALNTVGQTAGYAIPASEKKKIAETIAESRCLKDALPSLRYLNVPKKLLLEAKLLGSRFTAKLLMKYLTFKFQKRNKAQ